MFGPVEEPPGCCRDTFNSARDTTRNSRHGVTSPWHLCSGTEPLLGGSSGIALAGERGPGVLPCAEGTSLTPRASSLPVPSQRSSGRAGERDPPANFPSDFIFLEFPPLVTFLFFFFLIPLFFFFGQLEKIMFWLPWKHTPKPLVGPRHAGSSRTDSHGGGVLPSLPESGRRCSPAGLGTRGPDLPSVPTPVYLANTALLTNSWGMPWDRKAGLRQCSVTSCWTLCKRKKKIGSRFKAVKMRVGIFSSLCHFPPRPKFTFCLSLFVFFSLKLRFFSFKIL